MKLKIKEALNEDIKELELVDNQDGTIAVILGDWSLITFGFNDDNRVVFARNGYVDQDFISTDTDGKIVEIDEGDFVETE